MSKGLKKKLSIKLMPGQAAFVADVEILQHIADTYLHFGQECEDKNEKNSWLSVSDDIMNWINETYHSGQEDGQEEDW